MTTAALIATLFLAQGSALAADRVDVAYEELSADRNSEAAARIQANAELAANDPARLINLGIALARQGRADEARKLFNQAAMNADRLNLETATGEWIDSRVLARRALAALDRGEFGTQSRTAMR